MFEDRDAAAARPLWLVPEKDLDSWLASQEPATRHWLADVKFRAERHQVVHLAAPDGSVAGTRPFDEGSDS